ncbi:MAG: glycosyltransferase [Quinella sp. 1Q5]|nr:glycosyltransferase [Quinella sp. 1Q5]
MHDKQSINPTISVIIPMYNAEQYVGECLDSLLAQTFQDFEVIVVDDCSTDNSVETVKGYLPKFNGRLKLSKTQTNSGGCAVPRNVGLPLASGKYIYFMDSDDALTKTGLEEMYTLAKEYDADVVYCERYYMSTGVGEDFIENIHVATRRVQKPPYVEKPTLESEDLFERVQGILNERYWAGAVFKFVRHDLLKEHKIVFPHIKPSEDDIWTYGLVFFAKRWLRVPNMIYIRRMREDSITGTVRTSQEALNFWLNPVLLGLKELDNFMNQIEFFKENPQQRYAVLEKHFQGKLNSSFRNARQLTPVDVYEAIKKAYGKYFGDYDVLISSLCTQIFNQNQTLNKTQQYLKHAKDVVQQSEKNVITKDTEISRLKDFMSYILEFHTIAPTISVIIPLYNAEKYIGECLDSVLAQSFKNFEVIVVDDCSTDNSVAIVESYIPKFDGRLRIAKTEENTGSPGDPGNLGVSLSRGKYLIILDNDDTITPDALEKLYSVAKDFNADVVVCERFYWIPEENWNNVEFRKELKPVSYQKGGFVSKPTLVPFDVARRVQDCFDHKFLWSLWHKLIRRDYLIENNIRFQNTLIQDMLATCCLVYTAKRFVRVPYVINHYRVHKTSLYRKKRDSLQQLQTYMSALKVGFNYLDDFLNKREFFQKNPKVKQLAFSTYFHEVWDNYIRIIYDKIPAGEREEALRKEFANIDNTDLMAFLFNVFSDFEKLIETKTPSPEFKPFITARIDLELRPQSKNADFQIFTIDAAEAEVFNPTRTTNNGIIYQVLSYKGQLEIVAKATVDGQFRMWLRGMDIRSPEDNSKRIPYWIDYTNLTINEKTLFDKPISVCHDKPYRYKRDVKEGEELKIQVKWFPHRSDITQLETVTVQSPEEQVPRKFKPFNDLGKEIKQRKGKVSVIVFMYNAEKYIGECLDSLLAQTFQNFEVIVVDDCSTDKSVKIIEGYVSKFNEQLTFTKTETHLGNVCALLNVGLNLACGEYVLFMDANDFIDKTALGVLYKVARESKADVVYTSRYRLMNRSNESSLKRDGISKELHKGGAKDKRALLVDASDKLLQDVLLKNQHCEPWTKFVRYEFLTENKIVFPEVIGGEELWSLLVCANAKKFLRLPTSIYFMRQRSESKASPSDFVAWFKSFKDIVNKVEFLKENSALCYQAAKTYFDSLTLSSSVRQEVYDTLLNEATDDFTKSFCHLIEPSTPNAKADNSTVELMLEPSAFDVSVVIPLYNGEQYIGECLDSLLAQTLKSFEVIVVDDCSTDNSVAVVNSYSSKFGGRLKLTKTSSNSSGSGVPRNKGLFFCKGEYVFFMDVYDTLTQTGLETMYNAAKKFGADTVYCENFLTLETTAPEVDDTHEPTLETNDLTARFDKALKQNYALMPWLRLVSRHLLIENNINFSSGSNNVGWAFAVLLYSKKFLRIPNACYIKRTHDTQSSDVHKWMSQMIVGLKEMNDFMDSIGFFKDNPYYRYDLLNLFIKTELRRVLKQSDNLSTFKLYDLLREHFGEYLGEHVDLVSCLFSMIISQQKEINQLKTKE